MEIHEKFVQFCHYCKTCQHLKLSENESPCAECLEHAVNNDSIQPVYYKEQKQ